MRHPARWAALAVGSLVAVLGIVLATQVGTNPQADIQASRLLGQREPSFDARTFDGQAVSSAGLAGKAVIVNFWNSWCTPCQQELPALKVFQAEHAADPSVAFVGILRDDTVSAARTYAAATGMTWTLVGDPGSNLSLAFGTRGQPETFAISPGGLIVGSQIGPASTKNLDTMLAAAKATP
jgi:cytochrome c biogenesis protein CcmG/thiol:disulfide interchange protein DsbE